MEEPLPAARARIAPSTRLVVVAALALLPPAAAEVAFRETGASVLLLAAVALAVAAVVDAALGLGRAGGVRAVMRPLTRLSLGRAADLEVDLFAEEGAGGPGGIRVALAPPPALGVSQTEVRVVLAGSGRATRVAWAACPRRRGSYRLDGLFAERPSPAGFWQVRWTVPLGGELRVYPNLLGESRRLAALFVRRPLPGWRVHRQVGRGRDFEKLRDYVPGDGFDEIHWKATAKRGHPVTKVFQVERTQEVYAIIDASRLSGRPAGAAGPDPVDDTLLERQVNAGLALAVAAQRQGDLFGLATYADRPRGFVRARGGAAHFQACREALVGLRPEAVSPDYREVCTFLRGRLTKRALLVFLTSLDDAALAESFLEAAALVARRHLVVVASPLPRDAAPLFAGEPPASLDDVYARLGGHVRWQGLQDLGATLRRHGAQLVLLGRDELAAGAVSHYLDLKQRQVI